MRVILIRTAIGTVVFLLLWIFGSRPVSIWLDRFTTARVASLSTAGLRYDGGFRIGELSLVFVGFDNMRSDTGFRSDASSRLFLVSSGHSFPLGKRLTLPSDRSEIDFSPDAGDEVTLTLDHSWLAWPTFFDIKIMTRTAWFRRHAYYRLLWKKKTGEKLDMVWRYEQQYYPKNNFDVTSGWLGPFMMYNSATGLMRVSMEPGIANTIAGSYLASKGWKAGEYRLESRGSTADGKIDLIAAIFLADEHATSPGGGKSLVLSIDRTNRKVVKEIGAQ